MVTNLDNEFPQTQVLTLGSGNLRRPAHLSSVSICYERSTMHFLQEVVFGKLKNTDIRLSEVAYVRFCQVFYAGAPRIDQFIKRFPTWVWLPLGRVEMTSCWSVVGDEHFNWLSIKVFREARHFTGDHCASSLLRPCWRPNNVEMPILRIPRGWSEMRAECSFSIRHL